MNLYGTIILATLAGTFLIKVVADFLNLRAASPELPEAFRDVYDPADYRRSQEYLRANTKFSLVSSTFDLALLLVFWFAGGFNWLDQFIRAWGFDPVVNGVLYIGALLLLQGVVGLPFSIWHTFVLEEKFGFNQTTPKVFAADLVKTLLLSALLGAPVLAVILWFFQSAGPLGWLWAWGGVTVFSLLLQYVAPTWIMPMFNKFEPLEDGELRKSIMDYAAEVRFPLTGIYVMDGSKRSAKGNAFFTGFGKNKRIALFDTLIRNHSTGELVAVLAHEIGHFKKKHILMSMVLSMLNLGVVFYLLSLFMNNRMLFDAFAMQETSVYASLLFFMLLYNPVEFIISILMQMLSRHNEFEADHYAVTTYRNGVLLADALKKLSRQNLSNLTPHPFNVFLNYSHPPVLQRVERIEAAAWH
ncbi:peptidase M48 [Chlorobaculum limnaeum]|uniref:Peptidase M48 n=1 Tax=Chlorobaculum limnaeum TaxID=274537 RepID=A0A1D8D6I3_CHLLM|nr:M48 family metallopeptidase [Chlorobaculum limnaeum]AOS83199.1 peptidase M48 [Chlorobaculum limnaeum]